MKSLNSIVALLVAIVAISSLAKGFKPEIYIYLEDGSALYFDKSHPDLSAYQSLITASTYHKICTRGLWFSWYEPSYEGRMFRPFPGIDGTSQDLHCSNYYIASALVSLRSVGPNDTLVYSLSLYSGEYAAGDEIIVTGNALIGIATPITSVAITGNSDWTLFKGQNLDGDSICIPAPKTNSSHRFAQGFGNFTTIGSVFKGCDPSKVTLYKETHISF